MMMIPAGMLIVLAIVLPWYVALYQRDGWTYITAFFFGENLARYTEGLGVNATRGPLFYLPVVFSDAFPLSAFLVVAAMAWFLDRRTVGQRPLDPAFRIRTLLWLWILAIVGFFTISAAKQDLYIFPIVPAVAALGGIAIGRAVEHSEHLTGVRRTTIVLGLVLLVLAGGLLYLFAGAGAVYALRGTILMAGIGIAGGIATIVLSFRPMVANGLLALAATLVAMNWVFVLRVLPSFEAYKPVSAVARVLGPRLQPDDIVATYNVALPSLVYYLERHVEMAYDPAPIRAFLESPKTVYVVLSTEDYEGIKRITTAPGCVVSRHPTFDVKLRNILARDPLPDLLVITNRCQ
jgi:4-amino-4-deoxy-L-arabinose transferase-like glycosyltransferase